MNYSQIDPSPLKPGYGIVYQGGVVDFDIRKIPGPLVIITMDKGEFNENYIDHKLVEAVLSVWIQDDPSAALSPSALLGCVDAGISYLKRGFNLYVHCQAGVSRSSYYDIALHMRVLKIPYEMAYQLVRIYRPQIMPNAGFVQSLQNLQPLLMGD